MNEPTGHILDLVLNTIRADNSSSWLGRLVRFTHDPAAEKSRSQREQPPCARRALMPTTYSVPSKSEVDVMFN